MVIVRSESQSTLDYLEPVDRFGPNDCHTRFEFEPFRECCALEQCKSDLYICKECPDENDTASSGCVTVHAEDIPSCPDDVNANEFFPFNESYQWLATTSSQLCCWDILMTNHILREFTINKTESMNWTVRYFEFGIDSICRSLGKPPPDSVLTIVSELKNAGSIVTNPSNPDKE